MTTAPGTPTPLATADAADLAEQTRPLAPDGGGDDLQPLAAASADAAEADALDQQREIGWDEEHDSVG